MKHSNYDQFQYLNWSNYSSWIHLAQKSDSLADFKIKINLDNPTEYNIFTDDYPLNYENINAKKNWIVLGEKSKSLAHGSLSLLDNLKRKTLVLNQNECFFIPYNTLNQ